MHFTGTMVSSLGAGNGVSRGCHGQGVTNSPFVPVPRRLAASPSLTAAPLHLLKPSRSFSFISLPHEVGKPSVGEGLSRTTDRLSGSPALQLRWERDLCPNSQVNFHSSKFKLLSYVRTELAHNARRSNAYPILNPILLRVALARLLSRVPSSGPSSSRLPLVSSFGGTIVAFWQRPNNKSLPQLQPRMPPPVPKTFSTAQIQTRSPTRPSSHQIPTTLPALSPLSLVVLMKPTSSWVRQLVPPLIPRSHQSIIPLMILSPFKPRAPMGPMSSRSL